MNTFIDNSFILHTLQDQKCVSIRIDILPLPEGRGFLPSRLNRDLGGFLLLTAYLAVHLAGDPG